jgi:TonB family protein
MLLGIIVWENFMKHLLMQFVLLEVAIIGGQARSQILPKEPDYFLADTYARAKTLYDILENLQTIQSEIAQDTLIDIYKDRIGGFDDMLFDRPPELIGGLANFQRLLNYPEDALKQSFEDTVYVKVHLSWRGTIRNIKIFKGGKLPSLKEAALRAVYQTRWKPARIIGDVPVDVWVTLPVRFNLEKN